MKMPFLTARWENLILVTYDVAPSVLEHRLAPGLKLDTRDGRAFVSLVAFDFLDTRVLGVPWPGYRNFPEINLRFYVRRGKERGVMFIREFVPHHLIALIARGLYNEPYSAAKMESRTTVTTKHLILRHRLNYRGIENRISVKASSRSKMCAKDSIEHFFKEHQWGFGRSRSGEMLRYEVRHPHWRTCEILQSKIDFDFGGLYGEEFAHLRDAKPFSQIVALGSGVSVSFKGGG